MMLFLAEGETLATSVGGIITALGTANSFLWGLFQAFLTMIMENALITVPVMLGLLTSSILIVVKVIRRFGVKGKR